MSEGLTFEELRDVVRMVVRDMTYQKELQVRTVAEVDEAPDLYAASFGFTFRDYLNGRFWSRGWVNGGAKPSELKGEFPAVFVELLEVAPAGNRLGMRSTNYRVSLVLIDRIECEGCGADVERSGPKVQRNVLWMMQAVLQEMGTVGLYRISESGSPDRYEWLTWGGAEALMAANPLKTYVRVMELVAYVEDVSPVRKWGNYEEMRGAAVDLQMSFCYPELLWFTYGDDIDGVEKVGDVNCC